MFFYKTPPKPEPKTLFFAKILNPEPEPKPEPEATNFGNPQTEPATFGNHK